MRVDASHRPGGPEGGKEVGGALYRNDFSMMEKYLVFPGQMLPLSVLSFSDSFFQEFRFYSWNGKIIFL